MNTCAIIEDLWPLYEEGLVQAETASWIEAHCQTCPHCQHLHETPLLPTIPAPETSAEATIARVTKKLRLYELLVVIASFIFAMNTVLFTNEAFAFIISYFVLGTALFYVYNSWLLTVLVAFIPTAIWSIYDVVHSYDSIALWWQATNALYDDSLWRIVGHYAAIIVVVGMLHTVFALLGATVIALLRQANKEKMR